MNLMEMPMELILPCTGTQQELLLLLSVVIGTTTFSDGRLIKVALTPAETNSQLSETK